MNAVSPDCRSLSILTHKFSTKGPSTICVDQFLVKIDPALPSLSSFINFLWAHSPYLTSALHNRKNKESSDFMYDTQITIKNTAIWFLFSLTGLDLYWLKDFCRRYLEVHRNTYWKPQKITNNYLDLKKIYSLKGLGS